MFLKNSDFGSKACFVPKVTALNQCWEPGSWSAALMWCGSLRRVEVCTDETRNHPQLKPTLGRMEQQHGQQLWPPSKGRPLKVEFLERLALIHGCVYSRSLKAQLVSGWARRSSSSFTGWEPLRNDAFHFIMKPSSCLGFTHSLKSNLSCPFLENRLRFYRTKTIYSKSCFHLDSSAPQLQDLLTFSGNMKSRKP